MTAFADENSCLLAGLEASSEINFISIFNGYNINHQESDLSEVITEDQEDLTK